MCCVRNPLHCTPCGRLLRHAPWRRLIYRRRRPGDVALERRAERGHWGAAVLRLLSLYARSRVQNGAASGNLRTAGDSVLQRF